MTANARQGAHLEVPECTSGVGRHQHAGPENQDSQHMIDQPAKSKRGRREGDGKKNVTTICDKRRDNLRHVTTICDIL